VVFCSANEVILDFFKILGLTELFPFYKTEEEALKQFG